jgi:hypothetical protein
VASLAEAFLVGSQAEAFLADFKIGWTSPGLCRPRTLIIVND